MTSTTKSILKPLTVDLFEEVEEPRKASRAELLFDKIMANNGDNGTELITYSKKTDTYANRNRKPLATKHNNLLKDLRPIDSSLSDIESNSRDNDFEPSAKTSRTRIKKAVDKRKNRVKFADSSVKKVNKKPQSKKNKDYPNPTKEAVLEAFQKADLPDYDEIAKYPLHVSKYTDRADPPTPPMHEVMAPFQDLLPSGWSKELPLDNEPNVMSDSNKHKSGSDDWETEESVDNMSDHHVPVDNNKCLSDNVFSESVESSSNNSKSRIKNVSRLDFRRDSLKTAGLGANRIASTPVQCRHNVTVKNISPICSAASPETHSTASDTFVRPQLPKNKKSIRKIPKASIPHDIGIALDIVEPSLSDLEKITVGYKRSGRLSRTLIESPEKSYLLVDSPKSAISDESHTIVKQPNNTLTTDSSNTLRSHSSRLRDKPSRTKFRVGPNDLSSIFNPKVKSTPLNSSAKYHLVVDRSHLDVSMAKMCRSVPASQRDNIPKTTTMIPVFDNSSKPVSQMRKNSKRASNVYHIYRQSIASVHSVLNKTCQPSRTVIHTTALTHNQTLDNANDLAIRNVFDNQAELKQCFEQSLSTSMFLESKVIRNDIAKTINMTPKKKVLLYCEPNEVIDFKNCFEKHVINKCRKIGEGSYGEVFASKDKDERDIVIKIIPLVRNENQSEDDLFAQILPELVISLNFNRLKTGIGRNKAPNFIDMIKATTTRGKFPQKLVQEWDKFDAERHSENEDPRSYTKEQLYIVFYLANGGQDFENYNFESAAETLSVFAQLALALAAAERALEFEHRDLHWGNVLIANTSEQCLKYTIDGVDYSLNPRGVFASMIDFSLSRMRDNEFIIFDDLAKYNDLFVGEGDYQFDIYRMMRSLNGDNWQSFVPKTNIFWLHYMLDKAITAKKYKKFRTNDHKQSIKDLKAIKDFVLEFDSATDLIRSQQFSEYLSKLN